MLKLERSLVLTLSVAVPIAFGAVSIGFHRSFDWDLMNYHYYNAFAFLNDRIGFDIAPAQLQSYFNPLIDLPFYWLANNLPAVAVAFVMGAIQGLNFTMVYLLFWAMTPISSRRLRIMTGFAIATAACLSPGFVMGLGRREIATSSVFSSSGIFSHF